MKKKGLSIILFSFLCISVLSMGEPTVAIPNYVGVQQGMAITYKLEYNSTAINNYITDGGNSYYNWLYNQSMLGTKNIIGGIYENESTIVVMSSFLATKINITIYVTNEIVQNNNWVYYYKGTSSVFNFSSIDNASLGFYMWIGIGFIPTDINWANACAVFDGWINSNTFFNSSNFTSYGILNKTNGYELNITFNGMTQLTLIREYNSAGILVRHEDIYSGGIMRNGPLYSITTPNGKGGGPKNGEPLIFGYPLGFVLILIVVSLFFKRKKILNRI
jgi:hypothetical protein